MKIGVCGIACEACPSMVRGTLPERRGRLPAQGKPFLRDRHLRPSTRACGSCFECAEFPCETTKKGPIAFGYCQYISGKS
ncbi:MAG: hypothetical protein MZV70_52950 [Desulfobacterales bacterium]|nr:hypothetical protein [Desulfobacterales bacterium]